MTSPVRTPGAEPAGRPPGRARAGLDVILEEIDQVVEPVTESVTMAPAVGIAVAGGPMITLPDEERDRRAGSPADSIRSGLSQAGPVAIAGMVVNGAAALVVVAVARLVTPQSYGAIAQLLGLFFILSMPGSAVLVGVVRRVTALQTAGRAHLVQRVGGPGAPDRPGRHRRRGGRGPRCSRGGSPASCRSPTAMGWCSSWWRPASGSCCAWTVACSRPTASYRALAGNLLVEGGVRTFLVIVLVAAHLGRGRLCARGVHQRGGGHRPRPLAGQAGLVGRLRTPGSTAGPPTWPPIPAWPATG